MILLIIFLICVFVTLLVGVLAGLSDIKCMKIPNSYSLYVIALFLVAYVAMYLGGQDEIFASIFSHIASAALMFVVTLVLFALKILGAGDSKFSSACAFWISLKYLPLFLFFMTLFGGLLGVVSLYIKRKKPFDNPLKDSWVYQVQNGADKVPYGLAIGFGMLIAFVYMGYFSPELLAAFVVENIGVNGSQIIN